MLSFYLIWSLSYFTLLWWVSRFWLKMEDLPLFQAFSPRVTLLIPFRNEKENALSLCRNINQLGYPSIEVLLLDDHSVDGSLQLLEQYFKENQNVKVLQSPNDGKKSALEFGVKMASGEIVLCSDADCHFPKDWVEHMVLPFQDPKIQLVAGAVIVEVKGRFLDAFQALDWASILLMTKYSFAKKEPLMCSGANLAYRKTAFEKVRGYEGNRDFASGDDEFLLKKIHKMYGTDACTYLTSPDILVTTNPESTWSSLINQRIRWASKWKAHFSLSHAMTAALLFMIQMIWVGSFYLISLGGKGILAFGLVWLIKVFAEKISLSKVLKNFNRLQRNLSIIQTSFVHPFYVLRVGIGALNGKFTWKGRGNGRSVNLESEN
ncbi:glycosyltransferase [Algoriphagus aquimarinus]|uniref:Glycosyltransferase, catalytic subunit of cellulose synthase and poly-beta-1,6-N-acetylglucosamine synthase n=1 Tax=Algoriphagus aquimarinus TaxID=237018 RepID=A0A1I0WC35_9BACT|nr:glycosyltransferase [Algoriphagus aquimarinus]SFA85770.1 Glycosyltransferase, catalytic subunit of cellulose synthase and poly-beta-1,6-N-acetylglucosamine synthase [Algoriphagus aquimarinus]